MIDVLPKKTKKEIRAILESRHLEDLLLLDETEYLLQKKRHYVFRMPPPGTPVIALMSGGLDTSVTIDILLKKYKLIVYPIHIYRTGKRQSQRLLRVINDLSSYFQDRYPKQFHTPKIFPLDIPPGDIAAPLFAVQQHVVNKQTDQRIGIPFQPSIYAYTASYYARFLELTQKVRIRTIVGGWLRSNSDWYAYESLTALRLIMLELCHMTSDYSWQYTSLCIEKELGYFLDKEDFIQWGKVNHFPLEKTWSCTYPYVRQCGICTACTIRKERFISAHVVDKTRYLTDHMFWFKVFRKLHLLFLLKR